MYTISRILNLGKVTKVPKLNEEKAIEEGAQLLSEIIILSIGAGLLTFEYRRSSKNEEAKQVPMVNSFGLALSFKFWGNLSSCVPNEFGKIVILNIFSNR